MNFLWVEIYHGFDKLACQYVCSQLRVKSGSYCKGKKTL